MGFWVVGLLRRSGGRFSEADCGTLEPLVDAKFNSFSPCGGLRWGGRSLLKSDLIAALLKALMDYLTGRESSRDPSQLDNR